MSLPSVDIGVIAAAALGAGASLAAVYFAQRNRLQERKEAKTSEGEMARVQDSKNALDAWIQISAANTKQIANLSEQLNDLRKQISKYENEIVPALEKKIADQDLLITQLTTSGSEQSAVIGQLRERISELETTIRDLLAQLESLRNGGAK